MQNHLLFATVVADVTLESSDGRQRTERRWVRHSPGTSSFGHVDSGDRWVIDGRTR